jgi:lipoprotein-releasing system permease protein
MKFENWISYRYLTAKKGRFLSFLNFVSIAGVAIGVASLIVVISVMTGFGNNLREKIIGTTPHLMIEKETGIRNYEEVQSKVRNIKGVVGVSPYVQGNVFLENESQAMGLVARGIDPQTEFQITKVEQFIKKGDLKSLNTEGVIIGSELARFFGFNLGDQLTVISLGSGMAGDGWRHKLKIVGVFNTGMADYDMNLVLIHVKKAQEIFDLGNTVSGLGVKVDNPYAAEDVKNAIYGVIGYGFIVKTWIDINRNLFEALFLEKWGLFIILVLMVIVASFNIISTLVVTVTSKIHDIGIMKSIGVTSGSIRSIFTKQGIYIGGLGTLWGTGVGLVLCYVLRHYVKVPAEIYSIDHVPVDVQLFDMAAIITAAMLISFIATIYPALKASQLQPVEALRHE